MQVLDERSKALLRTARRAVGPTDADRERVRAALLGRLAVGGATASEAPMRGSTDGSTAPPAPQSLPWFVKAALALVVGVGVTALAVRSIPSESDGAQALRGDEPAAVAANQDPEPPPESPPASVSVDVEHAAPAPTAEPSRSTRVTRVRPDGSAKAPTRQSSLAAELVLLREAQGALRDGDGDRALLALDDLARRHPQGVLAEERRAAHILALCAAGRAREARPLAEAFLRHTPASPEVDRVRASCAFATPRAGGPSEPDGSGDVRPPTQ